MKALSELIESARRELPASPYARWASILFSLSVLTFQVSIAAAQALLYAAVVVYVIHLLRTRQVPQFLPVKLPLALFATLSVISIFWAENPEIGWFAARKLALFLIWLLAVNSVLSVNHLKFLYQALFLESALTGLVAIGQFIAQYRMVRAVHPGQVYFYMTAERVHGLMGHWMNFGGQEMLVFAALLSYLLFSARRRKAWSFVLILVGTSIILNFTRGVWLGCLVAAIYLIGRSRPRLIWGLPVLLFAGYLAAPPLVRHRLEVLRHPSADPALSIRFEMWQVALRVIRRHPLVGVGPNNIEEVYLLYLPAGKGPEMGYREHMHNNFLQFAAERGVPCLGAWIWLMGALCWGFVKIRRRLIRSGRPTWVADAAIAAWLALVAEGFFEFNFGTSPVLMVFLFITATPFLLEKSELVGESRVHEGEAF